MFLSDSDSEEKAVNGAVDPSAISANVKKQRMDKAERVASIMVCFSAYGKKKTDHVTKNSAPFTSFAGRTRRS